MNSTVNNSITNNTDAFIHNVADYFDQLVPVASDDELFASGYLRGHFDLAVGTLQVNTETFEMSDVIAQVSNSLQQAISQGELSETDQVIVQNIWQQVQQVPA
jgi:hypothetical protein